MVLPVTFAIIGTGFSGLGAAIALRRAGYHDLVLLERADDVGGTWRDNTYPGCRCDVQSNLYSFSFAPKPDWSETYPSQPELRAYLRQIAAEYGVLRDIRFGHEVARGALGGPGRALAGQHQPGRVQRPVPDRRHRGAGRAVAAGHPRHRAVRRHHHALGALGRRAGRRRASGWR